MITIVRSVSLAAGLWVAGGLATTVWGAERPLQARTDLAPFHYTNAPDVMPNYLAGESWATQGRSISEMQVPLSPAESAQHLVLQPGFRAELWAAEPEVVKPIALAWDQWGRLWIAETVDYPNDLQPEGEGHDRIKICEDTDGDGQADKFTVFADRLSIPTSLCFARGGVIVIENGHTLLLRDTDGDDRADERRVLFSGWGTRDTHATASNLRYGLDNWIWGTVGYSGFEGEVGGETLRFGQGVFRFKPDGSKLEFVRSSNNNTWGLGLTEDGTILGSTANNNASWHMAIPNRFYEAVAGWGADRMETIADSQSIYPVTDKIRQVDWHMVYTAGAGHALYTARSFPREYQEGMAFVAEPTGHLVGFFRIQRDGATYKAINLGSFLASDDEWTAPIVAEVGPDGALWVIDWYNYIVQHNPTPIGFQTGKGNAYETSLRDKTHGRIYRVTHRSGAPTRVPDMTAARPKDLVDVLKNDNQLWRLHAQRLLVESGDITVGAALVKLIRDKSVDDLGLNVAAMHALWTLHGLGLVDDRLDVLGVALDHPSGGVRRTAVNVLPRTRAVADAFLRRNLLRDPDLQVRLATYLALAETEPSQPIAKALLESMRDSVNAGDRWLRDAATSAAARNGEMFVPTLLLQDAPLAPGSEELIRVVARQYATAVPRGIALRLAAVSGTPAMIQEAFLDGMVQGWPADQPPQFGDADVDRLRGAIQRLTPGAREQLLVLAQKWNRLDLFPDEVAESIAALKSELTNPGPEVEQRVDAARKLVRLADETATVAAILEQVTFQAPPELASGLLRALSESRRPETGGEILAKFENFTPSQKGAALNTLLRRPPWAALVLDQLEAGKVNERDLARNQWQALRNHPDPEIARRAESLEGYQPTGSAELEALVQKFLPAARREGDAKRGQEVFTANCAVCHRFYGEGGKVGPDLSGIGARTKEDVLTAILDPNRSVEANYRLWTVSTKDDETLSGRLDSETQTSIDLYDAAGQKHSIQRGEIEEITQSELSIMPTGFEALGEDDLAALLEFMAAGARH